LKSKSGLKCPSIKEGCIEMNYLYKFEKHLFIELFFEGGITSIEIIESKGSTQSKIIYSPD
jgi:hypothetical protein